MSDPIGTILHLLATIGPCYGLDMVHASNGVLQRGSIYVYLTKIEDEGWLESEPDLKTASYHPAWGDKPLCRRIYRITRPGLARLRELELQDDRGPLDAFGKAVFRVLFGGPFLVRCRTGRPGEVIETMSADDRAQLQKLTSTATQHDAQSWAMARYVGADESPWNALRRAFDQRVLGRA